MGTVWKVLLAIVVGAGGGFAAGAAWKSKSGKKDREASDRRTADEKVRSEGLAKNLTRRAELCGTHEDLCVLLVAMTAVGIAVANVDGETAPSERKEIDRFVAGVLGSAFPQIVKDQIAGLYADPPSFEEALRVHLTPVMGKPFFDWTLIEEMIDVIAEADGELHHNERPLRSILASFRENGGFDRQG